MNILEKIVAHKRQEVARNTSLYPARLLEKSIYFEAKTVSMTKYLRRHDKTGVIAEFKRQSPSKGTINKYADVEKTTIGYMQAGASGLSILTDKDFFGGKNDDLTIARKYNFCPILRKDFIVDPYQIIEAKSIGADAILLIAAILKPEEVQTLASFAHSLGLEVLMEVHEKSELETHLCDELDIVGVNNRDLKTFTTSVDTSFNLAAAIPDQFLKISESGLSDPQSIVALKKAGYEGFLMGEHFMKSSQPELACRNFIDKVKKLSH